MEIKQIYGFVNGATNEALGVTDIVLEDLSNLSDVGTQIFNANAMDKYVKALVNRIGKEIFVNRVYQGSAPSVMMDGWEFGSVLQKISTGLPEATENESWELENNRSYDPHVFHKPEGVIAKFYNKYITFEIDMSFTENQLKMSFTGSAQLNAFISMLYTSVENSMTVKLDELIRRNINNMIIETVYDDFEGNDISEGSGVKAINLLYLYNQEHSENPITAEQAIKNTDFIKFASYYIKLTHDRIRTMSTLFNIGKQPRFTPSDLCKIVMLTDFASAADTYLQSSTFHNELTKLPEAERVAYWQGTGKEFTFEDVSRVNATSANNHTMQVGGILCVMFDRWAVGVSNVERKVTSQWTPNAEFFTNFYKYKAGYFNDLNENFVVFYVA